MSDEWAVPSERQRAAWDLFRKRCLARGLHDPGVCPQRWPADPALATRIIEILRAAAVDEATLNQLAQAMGRDEDG